MGEDDGHRQAVAVREGSGAAEPAGPVRQHLVRGDHGQVIEVGAGETPFIFGTGRCRDLAGIHRLPGPEAGAADIVEILPLNAYVGGSARFGCGSCCPV